MKILILLAAVILVSDGGIVESANGNIIVNNGQITCGDFQCPTGTYKCVLTQKSVNYNDILKTNICSAQNGYVLYQTSTTVANPTPGSIVNTFAEAGLGGTVLTCENCSTSAEAQAELNQKMAELQQGLNNMGAQLQQQAQQREESFENRMNAMHARLDTPFQYGY